MGVTPPSSWPGVGHVVSRLPPPTSRPIQTRFPFGSAAERLSLAGDDKSPDHYAKGTPSGIPLTGHSPPTACRHVVSGSISRPSPGFFSPVPHGTGSLSVSQEYLALEDGPPIFRQDTTCPALLVFISRSFSCTGLSPCIASLSRLFH